MDDETPARSPGGTDSGRHCPRSSSKCSPLQARAPFLANWDWQSVISINQRACTRGRAQSGFNSETVVSCEAAWSQRHIEEVTLGETLDLLRDFHRRAPFLFFNGNTFSFIRRELALAIFSDLPPARKREAGSAVAHYIAGVLDRDSMAATIESLWASASFQPGDKVRTLKGSLRGKVLALLDDGRVKWQADTGPVLIALPESLVRGD